MVAEAYLLPLPTADPGTWAPMSPAQVCPGCVLWTRWRPRRRLEPEKSRDAQEHGELRKLKPEEKYDVREEEDLTWRTWSPCVSVAAERHATSAPPRRTLRRPAIQAAVEDGPGATGSAGHPSPRQGTPGLWIRIPARSGCGRLQTPRGTPRAIRQLMSNLRSQRRRPDRPQGQTQPQNPAWSMTPRRWRGPPEPERRLWPGTRSQRGIAWATHPWRRSPRRREPRDAPDQVESTLSATASTCPFFMGKYPKMGMDAIVHRLDRLDNAKDGLEEDVAGILDDQSAAERDMVELRAERDRYRENLELALQKQQRVVDSLLHLVEDMSGRLKRLEERQPLTSAPELPAKPAAAELVERVKTLRSAMDKPMGGPAVQCSGNTRHRLGPCGKGTQPRTRGA